MAKRIYSLNKHNIPKPKEVEPMPEHPLAKAIEPGVEQIQQHVVYMRKDYMITHR